MGGTEKENVGYPGASRKTKKKKKSREEKKSLGRFLLKIVMTKTYRPKPHGESQKALRPNQPGSKSNVFRRL